MSKQPWELPKKLYAFYEDVRARLGEIAAASLACVLLDDVKRFVGLSPCEVTFIRELARAHEVILPI